MELYNTPAHKLREMLTARQISTVEIVQNFLSRIRSIEQKIKAFITITENVALEQAKAVDKKIATGEKVGKLAGIPIAVKDNICTKDIRTTCASKILGNFISQYDASVIERIKNEDAIIIGKTNMDEFAMGSSCENSAFFPTRNPWNLDTTPGGSSGGSAAAVAAGEAAIALGSDTGGSIRQPAALTGTVGFKPTYGLVSRYGLIAFASSLDQIGPIAKCVDDAILLTEVICGKDPMDSTSVTYNFNPNGLTPVKGLRVGVPKEYFGEGVDREIASAITGALKLLERLGAKLIDVELPLSKYSIATYYIVAPAEASSNLARYDGAHYGYRTSSYDNLLSMYSKTRYEGFGPEVKRRIMLGTYTLSSGYYDAYYLRSLKVRRLIKDDFDKVFEKVDVLVGPTSPIPAFKLGEKLSDPLQMYLCDIFTVATNLAGIPAISIPCGFTSDGLPIGLQIQGAAFNDTMVLDIARIFEREFGVNNTFPQL